MPERVPWAGEVTLVKPTLAVRQEPPVRVRAAAPWVALVGDRVPRVGFGVLTGKLTAAEVPPPGAGFATVTATTPATALSAAGTTAVSLTPEENVVASGAPFQWTDEDLSKPEPFTVSVNAELESVALMGERLVMVGSGLLTATLIAAEVPLTPGVRTVTA